MFQIDNLSRIPVYEQIVTETEKLISAGLLRPGDQLPSVRSLSVSLCVNPNTIQRSYAALDSMGLTVSVPGRGCFVSENAGEIITRRNLGRLTELSSLVSELFSAGVSEDDIAAAVRAGINKKGSKV